MNEFGVELSLIVAMDRAGIIGRDGALPWHLPNDLKRFKALTMGKPIVMGRITHESIGRPLPGRRNIVLSRDPNYRASGCECFSSLDSVLRRCAPASQLMIIGGAGLYQEAMPFATRIYRTAVDASVPGDVSFPPISPSEWRELESEPHLADDTHPYDYQFQVLERI
jgi:dihydrofolate reductase